ncbi:MAG: helix-turn-helix domain-containing protein [Planctomycetes bacterium]|nr:helix-turn-helix domain-containing protein [Planctomycetota bacterium]
MLTVKDVCKYLGISISTAYRLIKSGKLPAKRFAGQWRFEMRDLDKLTAYKSPAEYIIKPDLMTLNEVCEYLGLSRFTIYRLIDSGKLNAVKAGGRWKFVRDDVRQFLTHGREVPSHVLGMNPAPACRGWVNLESGVLSLSQASTILGVNRRTIYRLIKDGKLPATRVAGVWRLIKTEVANYMLKRKYRYAPDGIHGIFFTEQVLDKYRKDNRKYYVTENAYDGFVGSRQAYHDYKTLRSLQAIPKGDILFAEAHYRRVPVKGGFILTISYEQYACLPKEEYAHWSGYHIPDKQLKQLQL